MNSCTRLSYLSPVSLNDIQSLEETIFGEISFDATARRRPEDCLVFRRNRKKVLNVSEFKHVSASVEIEIKYLNSSGFSFPVPEVAETGLDRFLFALVIKVVVCLICTN